MTTLRKLINRVVYEPDFFAKVRIASYIIAIVTVLHLLNDSVNRVFMHTGNHRDFTDRKAMIQHIGNFFAKFIHLITSHES
jgi:hypothetical protein